MIILIGGEKGGTGKTTIAVNMACLAAHEGAEPVVVDTDKQRSASLFFTTRDENGVQPGIVCMEKRGKSLGKDLKNLAEKFDLVIVDAGGRDNLELRYSLTVANEIYIPVQPTQADLWTLEKMQALVDEVGAINPDLKAFSFLNRCSTNPRNTDSKEAREVLESYEGLTPLKTEIKERVVYQRLFRSGNCVQESNQDKSAVYEIEKLYREMFYE